MSVLVMKNIGKKVAMNLKDEDGAWKKTKLLLRITLKLSKLKKT